MGRMYCPRLMPFDNAGRASWLSNNTNCEARAFSLPTISICRLRLLDKELQSIGPEVV